jgi:outer membrane protein OmpA-like peptidoglycan-associated protein
MAQYLVVFSSQAPDDFLTFTDHASVAGSECISGENGVAGLSFWNGVVVIVALCGVIMEPTRVAAEGTNAQGATPRVVVGERYVPTIWVDPDGCEHWVMDDGAEGYMTPNVLPSGIPVCRRGAVCGMMNSDQFFATDSFRVSSAGRQKLREFFASTDAATFIITGHTDSRASDAYNMRLSRNRADAVAAVARSTGATVSEVRGYGERQPRASNATAEGMAQNRRVEIICVR